MNVSISGDPFQLPPTNFTFLFCSDHCVSLSILAVRGQLLVISLWYDSRFSHALDALYVHQIKAGPVPVPVPVKPSPGLTVY
jgi:hypothetical protein